ncbi:MAG: membrane integrity-associated transporter subunit PqiC [Burkholderiales bacterium]|nr:membrane integrity-associated transporter subunit PqiC [Burkholderiales bacterium]MBI3728944.1 membrane integrity-associated transporter subunit PqiC [Burkholderiales bacterium]
MIYTAFFRLLGNLRNTGTTVFLLMLLSACSSTPVAQQSQQYDFGPLTTNASVQPNQGKLQLSIAEVTIPPALDSNAMLYRLQYDNVQQLKAYSLHRWSMPPAQLLAQRLKSVLVAQGADVLANTDGANLPILRLEIDEFSQIFTAANQSNAQINLRASVIKGHKLIAQKSFQQKVATSTADAPGGARAMREAADASIAEIQTWIMSLQLK